jgi:hypothetical protein
MFEGVERETAAAPPPQITLWILEPRAPPALELEHPLAHSSQSSFYAQRAVLLAALRITYSSGSNSSVVGMLAAISPQYFVSGVIKSSQTTGRAFPCHHHHCRLLRRRQPHAGTALKMSGDALEANSRSSTASSSRASTTKENCPGHYPAQKGITINGFDATCVSATHPQSNKFSSRTSTSSCASTFPPRRHPHLRAPSTNWPQRTLFGTQQPNGIVVGETRNCQKIFGGQPVVSISVSHTVGVSI